MQSEAHSFLKEAKNREKVKTPKPDPQGKTRHCATQRESVVLPVSKRLKKPFRFKRHKAKQQKARCVLYELLRKSYSKLLEVRLGSALRLFDSFRELTGSIKEDRRIKPLNRSRERLQKSRLHGLQDRHENIDLHSQDFGRRGRHAHARGLDLCAARKRRLRPNAQLPNSLFHYGTTKEAGKFVIFWKDRQTIRPPSSPTACRTRQDRSTSWGFSVG